MPATLALLQLASPALPIGGYSYSTALEQGIERGDVHDIDTARAWIRDVLHLTLAAFEGPVVVEAMRLLRTGADEAALDALNAEAIAARETAELRLESEQMGFSLGRWVQAVCEDAPADAGPVASDAPATVPRERLPSPLSLPVAWAVAATRLGLSERDAVTGLLWAFAENQAMVLMKAVPLGQASAQRLLRALAPDLAAAVEHALARPRGAWSSAAPGLAIASARHEVQYSRLFRS